MRRIALSGAEAEFQKTGLLDETPQRSAGLRAVHALLHRAHCKGGINMETWNELVPNPQVCESSIIPVPVIMISTAMSLLVKSRFGSKPKY